MRYLPTTSLLALALCAAPAVAQTKRTTPPQSTPQPPAAPTPQTEEQKAIYALGYSMGDSAKAFQLSAEELAILRQGLEDGVAGKAPAVEDLDTYRKQLQELAKTRAARADEAFLSKAAAEPGAKRLPSGVVYLELTPGKGPNPSRTDTVVVHYRGTLTNGAEFDSSFKRGQPAEFPLMAVVSCWTEGMQQMKVGGKAVLVCPAKTGYGNSPPPGSGIPRNAVLRFEVELLGIAK